MAPLPAPGPTGNALSDANAVSQPQLTPQQLATVGVGLSGTTGSDCLWPPPATFGVGWGIIHFAFSSPCLFTKSEARAVFGSGLVVAGALIIQFGVGMLIFEGIGAAVGTILGGGGGKAKAKGGAAAAGAETPAAAEVALAA